MKLTGKEVWQAFEARIAPPNQSWSDLYPGTQEVYEEAAKKLQESRIAPLQGMVRELIALLEDGDLVIEDCADDWYKRKREALAQADQLLAVRKHQYRLKRDYQFPNAMSFIQDGKVNAGWVVNSLYQQKDLYGVVRYSPHGDDVAWIESPNHFDNNTEAAEAWVRQELKKLREEQAHG